AEDGIRDKLVTGVQTCALPISHNHYLKSEKAFTRWLVRDRRTPTDPLTHLSKLNVASDRRHCRRALEPEEFARLLDTAEHGKVKIGRASCRERVENAGGDGCGE